MLEGNNGGTSLFSQERIAAQEHVRYMADRKKKPSSGEVVDQEELEIPIIEEDQEEPDNVVELRPKKQDAPDQKRAVGNG